eukprot:12915997-Prorocentrum_lima.AAC.1
MLKIQHYAETWHGRSRRREQTSILQPIGIISNDRHKTPLNDRDHQHKIFERKLWRLNNRHII